MKKSWHVVFRTIALTALLMAGQPVPAKDGTGFRLRSRHGQHAPAVFPLSRALPDPRLTPGAINPAVTQATLRETICRRGGYTRSIRPPERYTEELKRRQIREYGYRDRRLGDFEEDHLISLELGGSPDSPRNLWPEPHRVVDGWGSYAKDSLEDRLHWMVCHRRITLLQAQYLIVHDWIAAYRRYIGSAPEAHRGRHHRAD